MYHYSKRKKDKKTIFLLTALISIIPFAIILIVTFFGWESMTQVDYQLSYYFYNLHQPMLNTIMRGITHLGDLVTQTIVTISTVVILFVLKKWRTALWYGFTVLGGALLLNGIIKEFYARARPSQIDPLVEIGGYSFPSGHSMGATIVYGALLFLILGTIRAQNIRSFLLVITSLIILAIGISRIYLAVHFPSDVVGGLSLGLTWLSISIALFGLKLTNREFNSKRKYSIKNL